MLALVGALRVGRPAARHQSRHLSCAYLARVLWSWHAAAMTWILIKLAIRLVAFVAVFWFATRKNPKIKIEPRWSLPLVAGVFAIFNVALYWILRPVLNLATFNVAWFAMPLVINLLFLMATLRVVQSKKWLVIDGVRATLWLAVILTVAHGVLYVSLDYLPTKL
jgi:Mycobacterial 4 TMS phage holin, superfamily IV